MDFSHQLWFPHNASLSYIKTYQNYSNSLGLKYLLMHQLQGPKDPPWAEGQFHLSRWLVVRALLAQWWVKTGWKCTFFGQSHMYQVIPLKFVWGAHFQKLSPSLVKLRFCDLKILNPSGWFLHNFSGPMAWSWHVSTAYWRKQVQVGLFTSCHGWDFALGMQEITTNSTARWVVGQRLGI